MYEKIVIVTRKTRLEELIERFNTRAQAKFYIEHSGGDFGEYVAEDEAYRASLEIIRDGLDVGLKVQKIDRSFVPTFVFASTDLIVTVGQDGLVANTAKYVGDQPIVAVNPDPSRFDGVLLPFAPDQTHDVVTSVIAKRSRTRTVTLAEAELNDGQRLLAFNEFYIGSQSHVSARYRIQFGDRAEPQSSSGLIVSTGAGSTGWLSSVFNMAASIATFTGGAAGAPMRLAWDEPRLVFIVREPFVSKHSQATLVAGQLAIQDELIIESRMPAGGVIFSDGIEADFVPFNSGSTAKIHVARRHATLVVN